MYKFQDGEVLTSEKLNEALAAADDEISKIVAPLRSGTAGVFGSFKRSSEISGFYTSSWYQTSGLSPISTLTGVSLNQGRNIRIQKTGWYRVSASGKFYNSYKNQGIGVSLYINNSQRTDCEITGAQTWDYVTLQGSWYLQLEAGQELGLGYMAQSSNTRVVGSITLTIEGVTQFS
ncbi:hypothetical protein RQN30_02280 [Arcanobacterium hippocoleae]